jgi:hypothetical protein
VFDVGAAAPALQGSLCPPARLPLPSGRRPLSAVLSGGRNLFGPNHWRRRSIVGRLVVARTCSRARDNRTKPNKTGRICNLK